jgi:nucleotide-binding universal stress UspA family protein
MSTHGYSGLKHTLLGSTTERVVCHAPCPVLTLREQLVPVKFPDDTPCRFKNMLVPTDFSETSVKAIRYAAAFAGPCGAGMTLLHVVEPPDYPAWGYAHLPLRDEKLKKKARERLKALANEILPDQDAAVAVVTGDAALRIVDTAKERNADLIVIATRGYRGLKHALLGSITAKVVRCAACPVLVVREKEREFVAL